MTHRTLSLAITLAFLAVPALAQTSQPSSQPARRATTNHNANWNDTPYGMNGFHPNGAAPAGHLVHFLKPENIQRLRDGNIKWVRLMIDWRYIEPTKGQFVWDSLEKVVTILNNEKIGISACLYEPPKWAIIPGSDFAVSPEDFGRFGEAVATRFKGRIAAYEVDNERSTGSWPKVAERGAAVFMPMLKAVYTGIKKGDPQAVVVMNGLWEFPMYYLEDMYRLGAKGFFDVVNIHYYLRFDRDPTFRDPFRGEFDLVLKQVDYVTKKYGDRAIPIWFTEYGWPATAEQQSFPVGEEKMGQYMIYLLQHSMDSGMVEKAFWYVYYMPDGMALWHEGKNRKLPAWHQHKLFQSTFPTWLSQPIKPFEVPAPASSAAKIANGDFEDASVWTASPATKVSYETKAPQSGKQFMHVICEDGNASVAGEPFALEPGKAYELTGYVRMKGGLADPKYAHAMIHIELLGEDNKPTGLLGPREGELITPEKAAALKLPPAEYEARSTNYYIADTGGEWYQVHYNIFTPANVHGGKIVIRMGHKDARQGEADFDNIQVKPLDLKAFDK